MQTNLFLDPAGDIRAIRDRLRDLMGPIRDAQRLDPVSQLVRSFIASRTHDRDSWEAFLRLSRRFRTWDALAGAPVGEIETLLEGVTLASKKAPELKEALRKIRVRAGALHLGFLAGHPVDQALRWLEEIHGIGRKIAAATLNFSTLRKRAFVVETNVLRVLRRFGFVDARADIKDAYEAVMDAAQGFDADDLYELHWHLKRLGQKFCTDARAYCAACPLSETCMKRGDAVMGRAA